MIRRALLLSSAGIFLTACASVEPAAASLQPSAAPLPHRSWLDGRLATAECSRESDGVYVYRHEGGVLRLGLVGAHPGIGFSGEGFHFVELAEFRRAEGLDAGLPLLLRRGMSRAEVEALLGPPADARPAWRLADGSLLRLDPGELRSYTVVSQGGLKVRLSEIPSLPEQP